MLGAQHECVACAELSSRVDAVAREWLSCRTDQHGFAPRLIWDFVVLSAAH